MKKTILLLAPLLCCGASLHADVKLPSIFGDHMVLQQEAKLPVWGWADPGEKVAVAFGSGSSIKAEATAGADGKWRVDLPAVPAGTPPGTLTVAGKNTITISDVLVGDVWLCSGQSNMEFKLEQAHNKGEEIPKATDDQIRLFHVPHQLGIAPCENVAASWEVCSPEAVPTFTAVGYFFGKNLRADLKRPIGLVESSWGGTPAQAWTGLSTLQADPLLQYYAVTYASAAGTFPGGQPEFEAKTAAAEEALKKWNDQLLADPDYQAALKAWNDASAQAKAAGQPLPPQPKPPVPRPAVPSTGPGTPTILFNGMINPLIPFAIRGAIWYQGEANTSKAVEYRTLLPAMITDWRTCWGQGDFPFMIVQLANFKTPPKTAGDVSPWALLREAQLKTLSLPNTGMAVIVDIGTGGNIHPPDKADVGLRLSLAARHVAYGESLVYTGPMYDSMKIDGGRAVVSFRADSVGGGLVLGAAPWSGPGATVVSKTDLQGFAVAGEDKNWAWADAKIEGNTVVVSSPQVPNPVAVRYAWADDPASNLYNKEGLPASPFRTDAWEDALPAAPAAPVPAPTAK